MEEVRKTLTTYLDDKTREYLREIIKIRIENGTYSRKYYGAFTAIVKEGIKLVRDKEVNKLIKKVTEK